MISLIRKLLRRLRSHRGSVSSCRCRICTGFCKNPCLPTPSQALELMQLGMTRRLNIVLCDNPDRRGLPIQTLMPRYRDGFCTFFNGGRCTLHNRGLKPMEGALAIHNNSARLGADIRRDIINMWFDNKTVIKYYLTRRVCVSE